MGDSTQSIDDISVVVLGSLNTDIIALGIDKIIGRDEDTTGGECRIGPGGKARNIAQMVATLLGKNSVAMVGRTSRDPYELWKPPINALACAGVNTDYVKILDFDECGKLPGIALIPVDILGANQIYCCPGVNDDFCEEDVNNARHLFDSARMNSGVIVLTLEMPFKTAVYAATMAKSLGCKVFLDPGGARPRTDYDKILPFVDFVKPNAREAEIITGIPVIDYCSATLALRNISERGCSKGLLTLGEMGALLSNGSEFFTITPEKVYGDVCDTTGCGDQTMAGVCYGSCRNFSMVESSQIGILAGSLQAFKQGIIPVTKEEIYGRIMSSEVLKEDIENLSYTPRVARI